MVSNILVLGAVGLILVLVLFGFLLGLLRGFRKSLYFTIIFIAVVIISFIFATMLAKSVYSGSTLWRFSKRIIPSKMKEGSEAVNSLKEFVRFYLEHNYTEVLENGKTAGESIVANENAMGIIDGLFVMILKIVMLIGSYIVLSVLFYLLFGLIYLLFLRQKPYIEEVTTTDEDGNESVEEREVKPKKKRLAGGLVGALKGFAKAMIVLIPISYAIGMMAQVEVPKSSSTIDAEVRYESASSNKTLEDILEACKKYDKTIGKMQFGLDDFVMDKIISYDVKDANGKKTKVVLRKEVIGFIDIYNTIDKEIGIDNFKDYDFKNNLNSAEMKNVVKSITTNLSNSKAITTLLTAVGDEGSAILKNELAKKDADSAMLFEEIKLNDKDSKWWSEQIAQLNDIYVAFANMELNYSAFDTKEYNLAFKDTSSEKFDSFIDAIFSNELLEMCLGGGLKYAAKKLPSDFSEVEATANQVVANKEVNEELKAFTGIIDIIKDDITFKEGGSVDTDALTIKLLKDLTKDDKAILKDSKLAGKIVTVLLKNLVDGMQYNGVDLGINTAIFDDANFKIHDEVKALATVLTDGFGEEYSLGNMKNMDENSNVGNVCDMFDSEGLQNSKLCNEIFSKMMPIILTTVAPTEDFTDVNWKNEYPSLSGTLETIYGRDAKLNELSNLNFETLTYRKLDTLANNDKVWSGTVITKILDAQAIPFIQGLIVNQDKVDMNYTASDFNWQNELKQITNVGLWASATGDEITEEDYDKSVSDIGSAVSSDISDNLLQALRTDVPNSYIIQDIFADTLITNELISEESDVTNWTNEMDGLVNVAETMEEDKKLQISKLATIATVKVVTIDRLEENTHKSVVLMNSMAKSLNEPMDTESMVNTSGKSNWNSLKWSKEMPRIGEVLKTLANEEDVIDINDASMDENTEIKKSTFECLEDNIAYSEALQNMFENAMKTIEDTENVDDVFPVQKNTDKSITYDENYDGEATKYTYSAWWNSEITGLVNVVYADMTIENKTYIKLSEFSDTESAKVFVVKALSKDAKYRDSETIKKKDYSTSFSQETNIGVSEYLQYMFKPQFRDLSRRGTEFFDFTETYNWDIEFAKIINVYLVTQMNYEAPNLTELADTDSIVFKNEVVFKLLEAVDTETNTGLEAATRNKAIIVSIGTEIDECSYLQYVLAPEMVKLMSEGYEVTDKVPGKWNNADWNREMNALSTVSDNLITTDNPTMKDLTLVSLDDTQVVAIGNVVPESYLLQSKMAKPLEAFRTPGEINAIVQTPWTVDAEDGKLKNMSYKAMWDAYKESRGL